MKRSLKTSGATSADCSAVALAKPAASNSALGRALTSGRRLRATQPARPCPGAHVHGADRVGLDAGRKPAAQHVGFLVEQEQRARREGHEVRQLRRNQRHRVGDAKARAHRLRDFVEGVDLAVRERDVFEDGAALRGLGLEADGRAAALAGRLEREAPRRRDFDGVRGRFHLGRHLHEHLHDRGIEGAAGFLLKQRERRFGSHRLVVRPVGRERVVVVDDRQDARAERNLFALQSLRIALAVPAFVVAEDERRHRVREGHGTDDLRADLRMDADLLELLLRQRAGLRQDVFGHGELADVVEQRRRLDALDFGVGHAEPARDAGRVDLHAADVRLRGLILGVDRERERFNRRQVQIGHLLDVPALVVDASQVNLVAAVGEVERRGAEDRQPQAGAHEGRRRDGRRTGADEIARRAPQEVLVPDAR